jgi:hypothetical protein
MISGEPNRGKSCCYCKVTKVAKVTEVAEGEVAAHILGKRRFMMSDSEAAETPANPPSLEGGGTACGGWVPEENGWKRRE